MFLNNMPVPPAPVIMATPGNNFANDAIWEISRSSKSPSFELDLAGQYSLLVGYQLRRDKMPTINALFYIVSMCFSQSVCVVVMY
jgi:hypothetical protein